MGPAWTFSSAATDRTAIELKYLVRSFHGEVGGELFDLPDQSAHDVSRYDVIKDVMRTESFVAEGSRTRAGSSC